SVPSVLTVIEQMAQKDPNKKVQAKAIEILAKMNDKKYQPLFEKFVNDSSYSVAGASLEGLAAFEPDQAYTLAKKYSNDALGKLGDVVSEIIIKNGSADDYNFIYDHFKNLPLSQEKIKGAVIFAHYLAIIKDADKVKTGVNEIMKFRNQIPEQYLNFIDPTFKQAFNKLSGAQKANGNTEVADYIDSLLK
ncbi:MAG TPA: HEAT repeat domain-containing protein, partial [Hanamia sp.]|nr:HEAT repeat domain-containing protein [Hanamia sp.]